MSLGFTSEPDEWTRWCAELGVHDLYYSAGYAAAWEREEGGKAVLLRLQDAAGAVLYPVIKVPLDALAGGEDRHDLRVAYDFGGPLAIGEDAALLQERFARELTELAREWRVVSEFGRLHPYAHRALPADAVLHARHCYIDLQDVEAELDETDAAHRRNVRTAVRRGLRVQLGPAQTAAAQEREAFITLYTATMQRVAAQRDFRFSRATLEAVLALPDVYLASVLHEDTSIAAAVFLASGPTLFYYLGASDDAQRELRPNNLLFDHVARRAATLGHLRLHMGGGHPNLLRFKRQIARHEVDYHLLRRIHDREAYDALAARHAEPGALTFPRHRGRLVAALDRGTATPSDSR